MIKFQKFFVVRDCSRSLQLLSNHERAEIVHHLADLLLSRQTDILEANRQDLRTAEEEGLSGPNLSRLKLNAEKLKTLHDGLKQIGDSAKTMVGQTLKRTKVAEGLELVQQTVPIGVLMVIFESRPDCLPQVKKKISEI